MTSKLKWLITGLVILSIAGMGASSHYALLSRAQLDRIDELLHERNALLLGANQKKAELAVASTTVTELRLELSQLREDLADLADNYRDEKDKNDDFEDQIRELSGTLGDLDKLAKTDKELLAKYSKVYFLNENYTPERLKKIDSKYILKGKTDQYFHAQVIKHLEDMLDDADKDGVNLKVVSAYRSFDHQSALKGQFAQIYGSGANTFSADQGYSEHQLGTTLDITTPEVGGTNNSFKDTPAYTWLLANAHKYGFILSYPEGNGFYIFEPWHWRFVGVDLARDLDRQEKTFYELEQREIDKYLLTFFD